MASTIEILKIRKEPGNKSLKAYVDLRIGLWTIHGWRVIQQDGQKVWVQVPQAAWIGEDKEIHYRPLLAIPKELKDRIAAAILEAWGDGHG